METTTEEKPSMHSCTSFFIRGVPTVKVESDAIRIEGVDAVFYFMGEGKEKNLRAFVGKLIEGVGK